MSETSMILLMGQARSGKSWLINAITGSQDIQPSSSLNASKDIKFVWYNHKAAPLLLVEVPGFDNTAHQELPDSQILTDLTAWLAKPCLSPDPSQADYPWPTQGRIAWLNGPDRNTPNTKQVLTSLTARLNNLKSKSTVIHQIELEHKLEHEKEKYAISKLEDLLRQRDGFVPVEEIQSVLVDLDKTTRQRKQSAHFLLSTDHIQDALEGLHKAWTIGKSLVYLLRALVPAEMFQSTRHTTEAVVESFLIGATGAAQHTAAITQDIADIMSSMKIPKGAFTLTAGFDCAILLTEDRLLQKIYIHSQYAIDFNSQEFETVRTELGKVLSPYPGEIISPSGFRHTPVFGKDKIVMDKMLLLARTPRLQDLSPADLSGMSAAVNLRVSHSSQFHNSGPVSPPNVATSAGTPPSRDENNHQREAGYPWRQQRSRRGGPPNSAPFRRLPTFLRGFLGPRKQESALPDRSDKNAIGDEPPPAADHSKTIHPFSICFDATAEIGCKSPSDGVFHDLSMEGKVFPEGGVSRGSVRFKPLRFQRHLNGMATQQLAYQQICATVKIDTCYSFTHIQNARPQHDATTIPQRTNVLDPVRKIDYKTGREGKQEPKTKMCQWKYYVQNSGKDNMHLDDHYLPHVDFQFFEKPDTQLPSAISIHLNSLWIKPERKRKAKPDEFVPGFQNVLHIVNIHNIPLKLEEDACCFHVRQADGTVAESETHCHGHRQEYVENDLQADVPYEPSQYSTISEDLEDMPQNPNEIITVNRPSANELSVQGSSFGHLDGTKLNSDNYIINGPVNVHLPEGSKQRVKTRGNGQKRT